MPLSMQIHVGEIASGHEWILKWIEALAASVSMIAVALGIWMSLREYRLKVASERRQQATFEIESEVRLQTHFGALMSIANGRSGYVVSEEAVKFALQHLQDGLTTASGINRMVADVAILSLPVGSAQQDAAVASIATLTVKYDVLREPGLRALESLCDPATSRVAAHYRDWVAGRLAGRSATGAG